MGARDVVSWAKIADLTTDSAGNVSYAYRPATNLYYQAVFAGTFDLTAGNSNLARVVVRQIAILRPTSHGAIRFVARGTSVTFVTTVRPSRPELPPAKVTFRIYHNVSGVWLLLTKRDVYMNGLGRATMPC